MTLSSRPNPSEPGPAASGPVPVPELVDGSVPGAPVPGAPVPGAPGDVAAAAGPDGAGEADGGPPTAPRRPVPLRLAAAVGVLAAVVVLVIGLVVASVGPGATAAHPGSAYAGTPVGNRLQVRGHHTAPLAGATSAPEPAPPSLSGSAPLQSHEVFGYAPYWTLPQESQFDVKDLTTLAYFSVDANADGTLDESGSGWNGYQSQDLVDLVNRSHAAGDRVVLTITCFSQQSLDEITSDPGAPARLSAALIAAVQAKNLDGVNFDFEGEGSGDQAGLTNLITKVSAALHATDPHWQVTMATYASAAGDPNGFYNIAALAPAVDGFFVMAYDMNSKTTPSATSPLFGPAFTDAEALEQYCKVMPPSKVILGLPFYGYDWPTTDGTATASATGPESPLPDSTIATSGHPTYWDPVTDTPWTSYEVGDQWHKTYFDDPTSLALKAQLANYFHIAGVGIWALGMDGNDPAMMAALLGDAPAAKDDVIGPPPPPGSGFLSLATYDGTPNVLLTPIAAPAPGSTAQPVGTLSSFATFDPALGCLQTGPPLVVWSISTLPGVLVVVASTPTDCAAALWSFPAPPPTASATTTTSAPPGASTTTTTTTRPPATTTRQPATTTTSTSTTSTTTTTTTTLAPASAATPSSPPAP